MQPHRSFALIIFFISFSAVCFAQLEHQHIYESSLRSNNQGMCVLGSWALVNLATGAYGWHSGHGEQRYFHQMNLFWNVVNVSIAAYSLWSSMHVDVSSLSGGDMFGQHLKTQQLYLINAGLDVIYIGAGAYMYHTSKSNEKRRDLLSGYGKSIMLQGGFLLAFDVVMYFVQQGYTKQFLTNSGLQLSLSPQSFALSYTF